MALPLNKHILSFCRTQSFKRETFSNKVCEKAMSLLVEGSSRQDIFPIKTHLRFSLSAGLNLMSKIYQISISGFVPEVTRQASEGISFPFQFYPESYFVLVGTKIHTQTCIHLLPKKGYFSIKVFVCLHGRFQALRVSKTTSNINKILIHQNNQPRPLFTNASLVFATKMYPTFFKVVNDKRDWHEFGKKLRR